MNAHLVRKLKHHVISILTNKVDCLYEQSDGAFCDVHQKVVGNENMQQHYF